MKKVIGYVLVAWPVCIALAIVAYIMVVKFGLTVPIAFVVLIIAAVISINIGMNILVE